MKHRFCAAALAAVLLLSAAPLSPAASAAFSDAEGTWAAEVIEKAEGYGLMNGYPDGTFGVGKELTRGEFVAVLCRMFGWDAASPGAPSFSDCPASHWAYSYVETALAHGVMDAGGAFRPEDYISREEMAVMLVRALGYGTLAQSLSGLELPFDDITDNRGYIAIAYDIGMITGVAGAGGQLKFLPRDSATREEAAAMLVRVYERYTSKLDWLHGFYAFSSYSQIDLTASMDAVSVGWARMEYDPAAGPVLNSSRTNGNAYATIARENGSRKISVTSDTAEGYNTTLISRDLSPQLEALDLPDGCTAEIAGETTQVAEMLQQMVLMMTLALIFVYFVMVAQFQSLLSPFIVLFTIPLAFTGGMLGLMIAGEQLSLISLMGFLVLMGVVVNNGIVFVDYANQLRIGGLERTDALVATGRTRMRPILMTTLTTVLAMVTMLFSQDVGSEMSKGMAIVIIGGLTYATLMTLFIVPVMYDLFYRKPPVNIDVGDDGMDDLPDDAAEFAAEFAARRAGAAQPAADAEAEPTFETTLLPPKEDAK